jgi:hypothetical protein
MPAPPAFSTALPTAFPATFPAPASCPPGAVLVAPLADLSYLHQARKRLPGQITAAEAWPLLLQRPLPGLGLAFWLRDLISARFGVQKISGFSHRRQTPAAGGKLDFFTVEDLTPNRMVLTARDRHLDVLVCVTTAIDGPCCELALTTSVQTHNLFGRAYMLPVRPIHHLLVHCLLNRLTPSQPNPL